jgi:hypothetical protein
VLADIAMLSRLSRLRAWCRSSFENGDTEFELISSIFRITGALVHALIHRRKKLECEMERIAVGELNRSHGSYPLA